MTPPPQRMPNRWRRAAGSGSVSSDGRTDRGGFYTTVQKSLLEPLLIVPSLGAALASAGRRARGPRRRPGPIKWGDVMRTPRATCPLGVFAIALSFVTLSFATNAASEEEKFPRLFVFGDSYTDINLASFWRVYPLPLQQDLGIPQIVPFGVGGARASPFGPPAVVPPGFHLQQQGDFYLTTNNPIRPRDLVTINICGHAGLGIL